MKMPGGCGSRKTIVSADNFQDGTENNQIWLWRGGEWQLARFYSAGANQHLSGYRPDGITAGEFSWQYRYKAGRYHLTLRQNATPGMSARDVLSLDWFSNIHFYDRIYANNWVRIREYLELSAMGNPGNPGAFNIRLYHYDNAGVHQLRVRFPNGVIKVIADDQ